VGTRRTVIVGAGGFARELLWLITEHNAAIELQERQRSVLFDVVGFVATDKTVHGTTLCDLPVLGSDEWLLDNTDVGAICGIGNPALREKVVCGLEQKGIEFVSVTDPSARMSRFVTIGKGSVICAGTVITTQVTVGNHVHVNLNCTIGHDVVIGDYVTIAPGVNISGGVRIGRGAELGTNSSVIQNVAIGGGSVVGAGAVVTRDVEENTVVVGVPAKPIKHIDKSV